MPDGRNERIAEAPLKDKVVSLDNPTPSALQSPEDLGKDFSGTIDLITPEGVYGWAWLRSAPQERQAIDILYGKELLGTVVAGNRRDDLVASSVGDGHYGFEFKMPESRRIERPELISAALHGTAIPLRNNDQAAVRGMLNAIGENASSIIQHLQGFKSRIGRIENEMAALRQGGLDREDLKEALGYAALIKENIDFLELSVIRHDETLATLTKKVADLSSANERSRKPLLVLVVFGAAALGGVLGAVAVKILGI
ncbi:hypothetical protein [Azospirillum sp. SYSU D00513]|uniref:hypothetical protein n=2 Tax=Pseudomonadati TaxID=3379134 RepID=UPI001A9727F2|nr:hypothetical protein [Azospirillum sp. SYSU D00513]